jgi:hypothetical protein
MDLKEYFTKNEGVGILATADSGGKVDAAVYSRPYVMDETIVAFIMADRLTRKYLKSNPNAAYLFLERGEGYKGKRLYLVMKSEQDGGEIRHPEIKKVYDRACLEYPDESLSVAYFEVEKVLPLIGDSE